MAYLFTRGEMLAMVIFFWGRGMSGGEAKCPGGANVVHCVDVIDGAIGKRAPA